MPGKRSSKKTKSATSAESAKPAESAQRGKLAASKPPRAARPSALLDTRIVYCGDCLDQLAKLPDGCVDLIDIDPASVLRRASVSGAAPR